METQIAREEAGITKVSQKKKGKKNEGNMQPLGEEDPRNDIEAKPRRAE